MVELSLPETDGKGKVSRCIILVLRNARHNDSEGICFSDVSSCLLILRCSFRMIFILIRFVATIAMKAFYDEAL